MGIAEGTSGIRERWRAASRSGPAAAASGVEEGAAPRCPEEDFAGHSILIWIGPLARSAAQRLGPSVRLAVPSAPPQRDGTWRRPEDGCSQRARWRGDCAPPTRRETDTGRQRRDRKSTDRSGGTPSTPPAGTAQGSY